MAEARMDTLWLRAILVQKGQEPSDDYCRTSITRTASSTLLKGGMM